MAQALFLSDQTVKNQVATIFRKLGLSDRLELALYTVHHRLHRDAENADVSKQMSEGNHLFQERLRHAKKVTNT